MICKACSKHIPAAYRVAHALFHSPIQRMGQEWRKRNAVRTENLRLSRARRKSA
jgi:hypothetical protein